MAGRGCCKNNPDHFCFICGKLAYSSERKKISDFVKRAYLAYFGMPLGDQDKSWAPHVVCSFCYSSLHAWQKKKPNRHLNFAVPMVWREPSNHATDCYFCLVETNGYTKKTRHSISYPNLQSTVLPVPHSELYHVPVFGEQSHCKVYHFKSVKKVQAMILNCPIPKFKLVTKFMLVQIVRVFLQKVTLITVKDYHHTYLSQYPKL